MRSYLYYFIILLSISGCGGGGGGSSASSSSPLVTFSQVGANSAVVIGGGISNEVDYTYNLATNKLTSVSNHQRGQTGASVTATYNNSQNTANYINNNRWHFDWMEHWN